MTLCQEAHPETCRSVDALPGCDCDLCKRVGTGKFWHCVACSCLPCSLARAVERVVYGTVPHRPQVDVVMRGDGSAAVVVGDRVFQVAAVEYPTPC